MSSNHCLLFLLYLYNIKNASKFEQQIQVAIWNYLQDTVQSFRVILFHILQEIKNYI